MREMKDSKIAWVGNIPQHWDSHPIYYYFLEHKHKNSLGLEQNLLSLSYGKIIRKDIGANEGLLPENFNSYNVVEKDDIVLRLTDLQNDKRSLRTGLVKERGIITSAYVTLRATKELNSTYFHYLLHSYDTLKVLYNMGSGVRQGLNYEELSKLMLIEPPLDEQNKIAEFLDAKCSEIDALVADIQAQIETLEQYKRSTVIETVLKGLKPGLPTKDSKIDWVGAIPSHWNTHPMYYYFEERKHSNSLSEENNLLSLSYGKVIRKDINTNGGLLPNNFNTYNIIEKDDIVLRLTDLQNDRRSLRTGIAKERGIITSAYVTLRATKVLNAQYFYYLLHAYDLMKVLYNMGSGVRQGLNYEELSKMMLIEPLLDEQNEIATFLDKKCDEINACIKAKKEQITTLEAYKKSIIFEYVTGKKEVV